MAEYCRRGRETETICNAILRREIRLPVVTAAEVGEEDKEEEGGKGRSSRLEKRESAILASAARSTYSLGPKPNARTVIAPPHPSLLRFLQGRMGGEHNLLRAFKNIKFRVARKLRCHRVLDVNRLALKRGAGRNDLPMAVHSQKKKKEGDTTISSSKLP